MPIARHACFVGMFFGRLGSLLLKSACNLGEPSKTRQPKPKHLHPAGVINYNDCKIQLLDLPGIISGAAQGKGWVRQGPAFKEKDWKVCQQTGGPDSFIKLSTLSSPKKGFCYFYGCTFFLFPCMLCDFAVAVLLKDF